MNRFPKTSLLLALLVAPMAHAQGDDDIDVGNLARKSVYVAGVPVAAASYYVVNKQIQAAWKVALPAETKAFEAATADLSKATAARDKTAGAFSDVSERYVHARDGYTYTTYHTEYHPQLVNVTDSQGHSSLQMQTVSVEVPTEHEVAPDRELAAKLKPKVDESKKLADSTQSTFKEMKDAHTERLTALQTAQKEALAGKRKVDAGALAKINHLKIGRIVIVAAGIGMAAYGAYDLVGRDIIDANRAVPVRRQPSQRSYESSESSYVGEQDSGPAFAPHAADNDQGSQAQEPPGETVDGNL